MNLSDIVGQENLIARLTAFPHGRIEGGALWGLAPLADGYGVLAFIVGGGDDDAVVAGIDALLDKSVLPEVGGWINVLVVLRKAVDLNADVRNFFRFGGGGDGCGDVPSGGGVFGVRDVDGHVPLPGT